MAFKYGLFHAFFNVIPILIGLYLSSTNYLIKGITQGISGGAFTYISMF
jgi:hypothetical protein